MCINVMDEVFDFVEWNGIWELVDSKEGKDCIIFNWIYKTMLNVEIELEKHKERHVSEGFSQHPWIF